MGAVIPRRLALGVGGLTLAASSIFVTGCGTDPAPTSVVCTDFRVGADLSGATFGVTGDLQRSYSAFAQAAGDLAAVANAMLRDVGSSCRGLAIELGADPNTPRVAGKSEPDAVRVWCAIASERFDLVRPQLTKAHFGLRVVTPKCTIDTAFQSACEAQCKADESCTESAATERCPASAREGICPGTCTGSCTGSETAPATCEGACTGTCYGTCGTGEHALDCSEGCQCDKTCTGSCSADCSMPSGGACNAACSGSCSEPMMAEACSAPLATPTCNGDVDCQKSCSASGAARANCGTGSFAVLIDASAAGNPELARIVSALERHLPPIFLASRGRANVLADGASDLLDSAGRILNRSDEIGAMGAACGMLIGQTGSEARKNLNAALAGSRTLASAVTGEASSPKSKSESDEETEKNAESL